MIPQNFILCDLLRPDSSYRHEIEQYEDDALESSDVLLLTLYFVKHGKNIAFLERKMQGYGIINVRFVIEYCAYIGLTSKNINYSISQLKFLITKDVETKSCYMMIALLSYMQGNDMQSSRFFCCAKNEKTDGLFVIAEKNISHSVSGSESSSGSIVILQGDSESVHLY